MKSGVPPGPLSNKRGVIEHKIATWCLVHPATGVVIPRLATRAEGSRPHAGDYTQDQSVVEHPVRGPSPSSQARDDAWAGLADACER
jgi:hypothetical protein